jgi:phosphate transport system substrate-binding protein
VAGSATFHPLAQEVARRASASPDRGDYHLKPTGTLAGIAALCGGDGPGFPQIVNATRRMREAEVANCKAHGVDGLVEVKVGYDAVALAMAAPGAGAAPVMALGVRDLYLALARRVPDPQGSDRLVSNPYRTWHEVNPDLPDTPILVIGSTALDPRHPRGARPGGRLRPDRGGAPDHRTQPSPHGGAVPTTA